jgi:hypothetical protein
LKESISQLRMFVKTLKNIKNLKINQISKLFENSDILNFKAGEIVDISSGIIML